MRVLFLANLYPWPLDNGAIQRVYHLLAHFSTRHAVTLVCQRRGGSAGLGPSPLDSLCERVIVVDNESVLDKPGGPYGLWRPLPERLWDLVNPGRLPLIRRFWHPEMVAALTELRQTADYDMVWAERPPLAEMAREAGWPCILVDLTDLESEAVGRVLEQGGPYATRPLHWVDWWRLQRYERELTTRFAHVAVCKADDCAVVGNDAHVTVVPNGVAAQPAVDPAKGAPNHLLFVGTMGYDPNVDAAVWFASDVLPEIRKRRPDVVFSIVGKEPAPMVQRLHDGQSILVHGTVPEMAPYYEQAGVVVAPIRLGAGTRLKILEALVLGKALVATTTAIEGMDLRPGVDVEIADDPAGLANACLRLMDDEARRISLGTAGRARALERYEWTAIAQTAERAVLQAIERHRTTTPTPNASASVVPPRVTRS